MSESTHINNESTDQEHEALMMAFHQAIAVQQVEPQWLHPTETVIIDGDKLAYEFVGINQNGLAVNRRPNPNRSLRDKLLGKNRYIEKITSVDKVANADLVLGFYYLYNPNKGGSFFDLESSGK